MVNIGPENQPIYPNFGTVSITVGTSAAALTTLIGGFFFLKAHSDNTGVITLGSDNTVTDGVGWTLNAGDMSPPLVLDNLNKIWAIASDTDQVLEVLRQY